VESATALLELGAVLFGLGMAGFLGHRLGMSPVPLYLLAGLAFGEHGPLPISAGEEFIDTGAEIGAVLLLLSLGLEYSVDELVTDLRRRLPNGLLDLVLNAAPGAVLALVLGWGPVGALALGGITYVSSSGIVAKLLSDLGHLGNRETPVILSLLVFEDLMMAVYLPLLSALLLGAGLLAAGVSLLLALLAVAGVFLAALRFPDVLARLIFSPNDEVLLLRVLGLTLLVAGAAQQLNVSATVGAFLVGLSLSGQVAEGVSSVLRPLRDLFAAVFFAFFGLQMDPGAIPQVAPLAAALAVTTAATKVVTGWWAAGSARLSPDARLRVGLALIPRGEFSILIGGLATAGGVDQRLGPLVITYVLLLAVAGPLLARLIEVRAAARRRPALLPRMTRGEAPGRRRDPAADDGQARSLSEQPRG
jgi:monovalent cation:H+ antiporter-2, CPA2 family